MRFLEAKWHRMCQGSSAAVPSTWQLRAGTALQRPSSEECWAEGWWLLGGRQGCAWGTPSPSCHSVTILQCSSALEGQDKREHPPISCCQSWPRASPQTPKRKSLWNYLEEAKRGKLEARPAASGTQPLGNRYKPFRGEEPPSPGGA